MGQAARLDRGGGHVAGLAGMAMAVLAVICPAPFAFAQSTPAGTAPLPPSSFELRRQELIERTARRQAAAEAARESRQRRLAGKGRAKPPDQPLPGSDLIGGLFTPKTAVNVSIAAIMATAAISALSDDTRELANAAGGSDNGGGDSAGGAGGSTNTTGATGTD